MEHLPHFDSGGWAIPWEVPHKAGLRSLPVLQSPDKTSCLWVGSLGSHSIPPHSSQFHRYFYVPTSTQPSMYSPNIYSKHSATSWPLCLLPLLFDILFAKYSPSLVPSSRLVFKCEIFREVHLTPYWWHGPLAFHCLTTTYFSSQHLLFDIIYMHLFSSALGM